MKKSKTKTVKRVLITVISALLILAISVLSFFYIGYITYEYERWSPDKSSKLSDEAILAIVEKGEAMTDEDYEIIYRQTGLTKIGVERVLKSKDIRTILMFRNSYFGDYELEDDEFTIFCNAIYIDGNSDIVPLKKGDIIVTSATNFSMWDTGHAMLIVEDASERGIEAVNFNVGSEISSSYEFHKRPDFMVLRLKDDDGTAEKAADYARKNLIGINYDPTVGVLSPKNPKNLTRTQCAHIIWYAFKQYGIDIDPNGGMVVSPKNIANSDKLEVVQVFGFDPEKLWE